MRQRNWQQREADRRRGLLGLLGYVQGEKADRETKALLKGMLIWVHGIKGSAGKSPLQLSARRIASFIAHYAPAKYQAALETFHRENS